MTHTNHTSNKRSRIFHGCLLHVTAGRVCDTTPTDDYPYGLWCAPHKNPRGGHVSFDTILWSWLTVFTCITMESWSTYMYFAMNAINPWVWIYFGAKLLSLWLWPLACLCPREAVASFRCLAILFTISLILYRAFAMLTRVTVYLLCSGAGRRGHLLRHQPRPGGAVPQLRGALQPAQGGKRGETRPNAGCLFFSIRSCGVGAGRCRHETRATLCSHLLHPLFNAGLAHLQLKLFCAPLQEEDDYDSEDYDLFDEVGDNQPLPLEACKVQMQMAVAHDDMPASKLQAVEGKHADDDGALQARHAVFAPAAHGAVCMMSC